MIDFRILLVDDDVNLLESLGDILEQKGYVVSKADRGTKALKQVDDEPAPQLVVLDLIMPRLNGLQILERIRQRETPPAVIILTGHGTVDSAVQAMKLGAVDYLEKPVNPEAMFALIEKEQKRQALADQNAYYLRELSERYGIESIVGQSAAMRQVFEKIGMVAASDSAVLITGESGTGKELIARHIHYSSPRRQRPLIAVNCATLAPGVVESELFGHERGAFTGAVSMRVGRIEQAHGGTLFLDEVGDIPAAFQAKLLRVLQSMEFERVGGGRSLKSDFRLICATHRDLREDIQQGAFRQDLFYRINVAEIEVPPLRGRPEDIPLLVEHFIRIYAGKTGKRIQGITAPALELLHGHDWRGNVRELKNAIERAFVYCRTGHIDVSHLPPLIRGMDDLQSHLVRFPTRSLEDLEKAVIALCLKECHGNRTQAAEKLGITRSTLLSKIERFGLD